MPKHPVYGYESRRGTTKKFRDGEEVTPDIKDLMFGSDYMGRRVQKSVDEKFDEGKWDTKSLDEALDMRDELNRGYIKKTADERFDRQEYEKKKKRPVGAKTQAAALKEK
jgi:hypothetical protein